MALYKSNPAEAGSGNDLSVSVTPQAGVHLKDLWQELERLEFARWQEARPRDNPRIGILGYPKGQRPDGQPAPNQPWYDGGDYTLLAAPKRLANGELGSRLDWHDVRDAIWRVYHPFQHLQVLDCEENLVPLEACQPESAADMATRSASKRVIFAHWKHTDAAAATVPGDRKSSDHIPFLRFTPTFKGFLAACLKRSVTTPERVTLDDLLTAEQYDFVELTGGFAVITEQGAFVIDDWHAERLPQDDIRREFASADTLFQVIQASANDVSTLTQDIQTYLRSDASGQNEERILLSRLTDLRIRLSQTQAEILPQSFDPSVRRFRQTLEARWGVVGRLEAFHRAAAQVDTILNNHLAQLQADKTRQLSEEVNENIRLVTKIQDNGSHIATELSSNVSTVAQIQRKIEWLEVFFVSFYATELAHLISAAFFTPFFERWSVLFAPIVAGGIAAWGLKPWSLHHDKSPKKRWIRVLVIALVVVVGWLCAGFLFAYFSFVPADPSTVGLPGSGGGH